MGFSFAMLDYRSLWDQEMSSWKGSFNGDFDCDGKPPREKEGRLSQQETPNSVGRQMDSALEVS